MYMMQILWLGLSLGLVVAAHAAAGEHPNVVVFVADDLGWADVGFHGGTQIETPSLDRLAREGVQLDRFYTTPICSPTRAALMTGRDPMRLGVAYGVIMPWMTNGVHPDEHFMPQSFRAAGYQTAMVGKWHLGHAQMTYHPNERGFDHFYGHLHTEVGYFPPFANQGGKDFQRNGVSLDDTSLGEGNSYETFVLAKEAARVIRERDPSRPLFLYVPFIAPHTPLDAPEDLKQKYADIPDERLPARSKNTDQSRQIARLTLRPSARPMYAAVVDAMDQAIGTVLDTLDDEGIADDTIVLFFSDNGGAAYATGGADNVPLRGGKGETFEGGIRVVASMRWPREDRGRVEDGQHHVRDGRLPDPGRGGRGRGAQQARARRPQPVARHRSRPADAARGAPLLRIRDANPRGLLTDGLRRPLEAGAGRAAGTAVRNGHELALQDA